MPRIVDRSGTALVIVDVQNDFLPKDGALAVPDGRSILSLIYALLTDDRWKEVWTHVIVTQDWHPEGHISFASAHEGAKPFTSIKVKEATGREGDLMVWPDHCIPGTSGSEMESGLRERLRPYEESGKLTVFRKGCHKGVEAYSGFEASYQAKTLEEADRPSEEMPVFHGNLLEKYFEEQAIDRVVVVGLATDYCVRSTCLGALSLVSPPTLILLTQAIRGIDAKESEKAVDEVREKGGIVLDEVMGLKAVLRGLL